MANWRRARSLDVLASEIRAEYPGTTIWDLGDQDHRERWSDHNENAAGVVCAVDVLGNGGMSLGWFANRIVAVDPPALKYVIYNRRIWHPGYGWDPYYGKNPHTGHVHVSVGRGPDGRSTGPYDDKSSWAIKGDDDVSAEDVVQGLYLALAEAANPAAGDAGKRGRWIRDSLRTIVATEGTNAYELQQALQAAVPDSVDTAELAEALVPLLASRVVDGVLAALPADRDDVTKDELVEAIREVVRPLVQPAQA